MKIFSFLLHLIIVFLQFIDYLGDKIRLRFNGVCLKQSKLGYTLGKTINIYMVYELTGSSSNGNDPTVTVRNSLFGAVTWSKNADIVKYGYSGYGIGFDWRENVFFLGGEFGINVIIFGIDMISSAPWIIK